MSVKKLAAEFEWVIEDELVFTWHWQKAGRGINERSVKNVKVKFIYHIFDVGSIEKKRARVYNSFEET